MQCVYFWNLGDSVVFYICMKFPGTAYRQRELVKEFLENDPILLHSTTFVQRRRKGRVPKG